MKAVRRHRKKQRAFKTARAPASVKTPLRAAKTESNGISSWEARLCELELRLTQLEAENLSLRAACQQHEAASGQRAKLRHLAPVGLLTLNMRGTILDLNQAAAALLGWEIKQLLGRRLTFLVSPGEMPKFEAYLAACREASKALSGEFSLLGAGGVPVMVQLATLPIPDSSAEGKLLETTLIDISERKQAEAALRNSEHNLRALIEASPHPIQFKDTAGRWLLANSAALELFELTGIDYHHKRGLELAAAFSPKRAGMAAQERMDREAVRAGHSSRRDETIARSDGSTRVIDFIKIPLHHPDGRPKGLVVLGYDVTERNQNETALRLATSKLEKANEALEKRVMERTLELSQANQALRENETRLQAIMNNSPSMIFLKDLQGRYLHFNHRFAREFGLRLEATVGKTDAEIFPSRQAAIFRANDLAVIEAGAPIVFDEVATHEDGLHMSIVTKFPLYDESGKIHAVGGIVTDITDRKRLEEEILRISEREKRRIAQDLHDGLGQELTGAWCLSEVLRKNLKSQLSPDVAAAARLSKLLKSAVAHTRSLSKGLHPVTPELGGLMLALKDLASRVAELFKVSCRFKCDGPVSITDNGKATHLYRIAQEAVTNSIKHGRAQKIEIALSATPELVMLAVSDDGVGFTKVARRPGLGMKIMTHRAGLIGGTLLVQPSALGGIKIVCVLEKSADTTSPMIYDNTGSKTEGPRSAQSSD